MMRSTGTGVLLFFFLGMISFLAGCEDTIDHPEGGGRDLTHIPYKPVAYVPVIPDSFPALEQPFDNPMTIEGIHLGRNLFFDPILSIDSTVSCSSCHQPDQLFTDGRAFSTGVNGTTPRSSMSLINVGFQYRGLFWDGRSPTLELQSLHPVEDPIEMGESWPNVERKLREHASYPELFRSAFGIPHSGLITRDLVAKALAQFERSLISGGNSKYDRFARLEIFLEEDEYNGYLMFFDLDDNIPDAECGHCHNAPLFASDGFFNNGIQSSPDWFGFTDLGRGKVTGRQEDNGMFKPPSLRNIVFTAPYMHDGRFETLEEVVEHYNAGGQPSPNKNAFLYPLNLTEQQKRDLVAFLHTLTDSTAITNPAFQNPF